MKKISDYRSVPFNFNNKEWGPANLIDNMTEFNELAKYCFSTGTLILTTKQHLSKDSITPGAVWLNTKSTDSVEFICAHKGRIYRFAFRPSTQNDIDNFTGLDALKLMRKECAAILKPFEIKDNTEVLKIKSTIPKTWIKLTDYGEMLKGTEIANVIHIDINSAYPAGVVTRHPEFKEFFEKHYKLRHEDDIHKAVINYAIGASQSIKLSGPRYPQLAKDAVEWTIETLKDLSLKLRNKGYTIIGYNTDGIFYQKKYNQPLYADENEGKALGQWKTDHIYDKIRFKSAGSYEYIEKGNYHPVVRGKTTLDKTTPRANWKWGDIFQTKEIVYCLIDNQLEEIICERKM